MSSPYPREQAASEMVGVLMLVAIIILAVAVISIVFFSQPPPQKIPAISIRITNTSNVVRIFNDGGDTLPNGTFAVMVDEAVVPVTNSDPTGNWTTGDTLVYVKPGPTLPQTVKIIYTQLGASSIVLASVVLTGDLHNPSIPFTQGPTATPTPTVSPTPAVPEFTINATAGSGGSINPQGNVTVDFGNDSLFTMTPDNGFRIANFSVDGFQNGTITPSYLFRNVTADHTIAAMFMSNLSPGLVGNYYHGMTWSVPVATRIAPRVWYADAAAQASGETSDVANWPVDYIQRADNFSVMFDGLLKIDTADNYIFYMRSDDGSELTVNGAVLISQLNDHSPTTYTSSAVHLIPGYIPISIRMYENGGLAVIHLEYSSPNMTRQVVTPLYHYPITPPTPDFTGSPLAGSAPLTTQFTDTSLDATAWSWDFGDGATSIEENPSHTYSAVGMYNVSLTAMNSFGVNTATKTNYVTVGYYLPGANAWYYRGQTWTDLAGTRIDNVILFADADGNTTTHEPTSEINWPSSMVGRQDDFSVRWSGYILITTADIYTFSLRSDDGSWFTIDGTQLINNGGLHSPTTVTGAIAFQPGYHPFEVTMFENGGQAVANLQYSSPSMPLQQVTNLWHVTMVPPAPVAAFTGAPLSGTAPLIVSFVDSSTNAPTSWLWNFGDNDSTNATMQNPVHRYAGAGTYSVNLTATNAGGSSTFARANYVVANPPAPIAGFTGNPTSGTSPLTVVFTDSSVNSPSSWLWTFGDGNSTNSTARNPVHTYANAGTYTVSLSATNTGGSNSSARTNYILVNPPAPVAGFNGIPVSGIRPLTVVFTDSSTNAPTSWSWTFGDGDTTNSTVQNPVHTYSNANTYTVSLTATNAGGSNSVTRANYILVKNPAPTVTGITPNAGVAGTTVPITNLAGTNFVMGTTPSVQLTKGALTVTATGVVVDSATQIHCTLTMPIPSLTSAGQWNVIVTNADGQASAPLVNGFTITNPPPTVTGITPGGGAQGTSVSVTNLAGTNFIPGTNPVVMLRNSAGTTITATGVAVISSTQISCTFAIPATAAPGSWNVVVQNADGQTGTGTGLFTVRSATHVITVSWAPNGLGEIDSPPGTAVSTLTVADGTSRTFFFVPKNNKQVISYSIDSGPAVNPGTGIGVTVTYTLSGIISDHTIAVTFG